MSLKTDAVTSTLISSSEHHVPYSSAYATVVRTQMAGEPAEISGLLSAITGTAMLALPATT